jgi:L-aminopeptidase/D-esterase-like protein
MNGLKVGHFTNQDNGTGVSVFLFENSAIGAYLLSGSAPASASLGSLDLDSYLQHVDALVLTGGSGFGLFVAKGVMQFLVEHGIGLKWSPAIIPSVPTAAIFDLAYKTMTPPSDQDAYQACLLATENNDTSGRIGAGTGATLGKLIPQAKRMTGGLGYAEKSLENGVHVQAYVVVNSVGDIRDIEGKIVAGACYKTGEFANCEQYILTGQGEANFLQQQQNTTLVAVFTNAKFTKPELRRISKMAVAGIARAVSPAFTCYDGDLIFAFSLGEKVSTVMTIGTMAAETVRLAILDAVKDSEIVNL